mgnify:CR=1 FL=1
MLGDYYSALFLFFWGTLVIGTVDNIARPYLMRGYTHTYPLMMFLVVLGGVVTMGLKGVVVGPLVLIVLMSFLHIYEFEYKNGKIYKRTKYNDRFNIMEVIDY